MLLERQTEEQLCLFLRREHVMRDEQLKGFEVEDILDDGRPEVTRCQTPILQRLVGLASKIGEKKRLM